MVRSQLEVQTGQTLSYPAIARDIRRLYDLGFFSHIAVEAEPSGAGVALIYTFEEKQFISEIRLVGNDKVRARAIRTALSWKEGDTFSPQAYEQERSALLELYQSKGFPNATVDILVDEVAPSRVRVTYLIDEGGKARIRDVEFDGNDVLTDRQLRRLMQTKRAWWFLGGKYDETKFEADLQNIVRAYGNHGRLEADVVQTEFDFGDRGKDLFITVRLFEGPEYHVENLGVTGNVVFENEELEDIIDVRAGDVHNVGQVAEDANILQQGYQDSGYVNARVDPRVTVDREAKTTSVVHTVNEDQLLYVRQIKISGNDITKDAIIRRQLMLTPGDRFDGGAMRTSQRSLENTGFFEGAPRLTLEDPTPEDLWTDLLVHVDEGKTGNFSFGAGYSTEEKFGGFTEISLRNFDIMNWPRFSGGGQQFSAKLSVGDVRTSYSLSFMDPELFGYPLSGGFDLFNESYKHDDGNYTERNQGFQLKGMKMLSPFVGARLSLRYVDTDVTDLPLFGYPTLRQQRDLDLTVAVVGGITRNTVDLFRDPSRGSKHDLEVQVAGFGGDNEFYKVRHDSTWYKSLDEDSKWVASFRTREGWIDEYGSSEVVPLQERFFAGGSATVRGYGTRDIGPRERRFRFFGEDYPIGGNVMFVTNTELKYKATNLFRLYAFLDTGAVWATGSDIDFGEIRYGAGLGFGVDVPKLGPIRVDYGFPLNPEGHQDDGGRLHLSTGFRF